MTNPSTHPHELLPADAARAVLVGRVWRPGIGPALATLRGGALIDITHVQAPTMRDLLEREAPARYAAEAEGEIIASLDALAANSWESARDPSQPWLLAPMDLQAVKAAGVTFCESLLERVIEEQARGDSSRAAQLRKDITALIGADLAKLKPGSPEAMEIKRILIERGAWSQYLEVGIGPDAEIFTKSQPLAAVGYGAHIGVPDFSHWNNPEPEIVLAANSRGEILGAALGNDVNLRDVEGRSALLLGKAKDNNASAAIGPFIRLFDADFTLDHVRQLTVGLRVGGEDGFVLEGASSMAKISRDPSDLMAAAIGEYHQYPDGLCLYLGTMFAPVQDRGGAGKGFTHKSGDRVEITANCLGKLANTVRPTQDCAPWEFGASALMRNLVARGLLGGNLS
jgi:fumarylacetoacetate (FAA) hydrolase family protein